MAAYSLSLVNRFSSIDDNDGGGRRGWCGNNEGTLSFGGNDGVIFLVNAIIYGDSVAPFRGTDRNSGFITCIGSTFSACIHFGGGEAVVGSGCGDAIEAVVVDVAVGGGVKVGAVGIGTGPSATNLVE